MTDETIFDESKTTENVETKPTPTVLPDHLKELVGEGKKYATVEKALESIPHAQTHIEKLEQELADMRSKVEGATAADEVYKTVQELLEANKRPNEGASVDEQALAELLDRKLTERDRQAIVKANVDSVKNVLVEKYGDKAKDIYDAKAKELGVSVKFLNDVVAASPNAAFELFGVKRSSSSVSSSSQGDISTEAFKHNPPAPPKSVMGGASTKDILAAWRAAKPTE